jgi:hypothetical protein
MTALGHRARWEATVSGGTATEVAFLVDGARRWVEHHPPYDYGDDGNYLVTSFLSPGSHTFTVKATFAGGATATDVVTATVPVAPRPPQQIRGTWKTYLPKGGEPAGFWRLTVDSVGWRILDTGGGGNLIDVAYLSPGVLEFRTGMATGRGLDGNGWCENRPGSPVRYRWSVSGKRLQLTFMSGQPCEGFNDFITRRWLRAS